VWVVLVDSDEFLELPYRSLAATVRVMEWLGADTLSAPFLQRFASEACLEPATGALPSDAYPWCSTDLYARLGQPHAATAKYPIFKIGRRTALRGGGNHHPPNGYGSWIAPLGAVTHHFKWRPTVRERLVQRAGSTHPYRGESAQYLAFLGDSGWRLPSDGAFRYSRRELFRRGLLKRATALDMLCRRCRAATGSTRRDRVLDYLATPNHVASEVASLGHRSVVVCGAGSGGTLFLDALQHNGVAVSHVVDRDPARWGSDVRGIRVCGLDDVLRAGQRVFVIGSLTFAGEMTFQVQSRCEELGAVVEIFSTTTAPRSDDRADAVRTAPPSVVPTNLVA
jgi:hypothetical protein